MKFRNSKAMQRIRPPDVETSRRRTQQLERAARRAHQEESAFWAEVEGRVQAAEETAAAVEEYYRTDARRNRTKELRDQWGDDEPS